MNTVGTESEVKKLNDMLWKKLDVVMLGKANLDDAGMVANLAGKQIKLWAYQLATKMFDRQVKGISVDLEQKKITT